MPWRVFRRVFSALIGVCICVAPGLALAALQDEIQVYTDEINAPGEYGLEWHINSTPSGVGTPSYPGEITSHHGLRVTAEFSRGLTRTLEIGLYVPVVRAAGGAVYAPGLKARLKWLPVQATEHGGFFAGSNLELGQIQRRFSESPRHAEIRNILGWRNDDWLLSVNPIFGLDLSRNVPHTPGLEVATKVSRKVTGRVALGWEYYNDRGPYQQFLPLQAQTRVHYIVTDIEGQGWDLNFGVGRGNTLASDKWTLKAVLGFPLAP
jgi:hypothetical protein